LFFDRDQSYLWNTTIDIAIDGTIQTFVMTNVQVFERCVRHTELSKRAWILQEHLLSPRTLHFSKAQVFWECREANACESYPEGFPDFLDMNSGVDIIDKRTLPSWEKIVLLIFQTIFDI
jgi:hypothetical protein